VKDNGLSWLSRRGWLKAAGAVGFDGAASAVGLSAAAGTEKRDLIYRQVLDSAPWSTRYGLGLVVFQSRLWVLGGTGNGTQVNDVWSSEDGLNWRRELESAPWQPRWGHTVFAFGGKLWVIGGLASVEPIRNLNDIWSSPDGKKWTREVADAPWPARHVWATTIHRDRMYLLGGATDGSLYYQDVLSSGDGIHWRLEKVQDPWFEKRKNHAAVSYRGKILLAGGSIIDRSQPHGGRLLNDVWSSKDGRAWTCVARRAPWSARSVHAFVVYREKLWLVGGELGAGHYATDLWSTVDGEVWRQETDRFAWPGRHGGGVIIFRNKVWIVGGTSTSWGTSSWNDIWTFEEGEAVTASRSLLKIRSSGDP
jgi:hypothetical protein